MVTNRSFQVNETAKQHQLEDPSLTTEEEEKKLVIPAVSDSQSVFAHFAVLRLIAVMVWKLTLKLYPL